VGDLGVAGVALTRVAMDARTAQRSWHDGAMRRTLVMLGLLAGCHAGRTTAPPTPSSSSGELSPALAPLAWWLGDWDATDGEGGEHWIAAGGAIYGVSLHGATFEVMVIDDGDGPGKPDGVLRFYAMPNGKRSVEFRQRTVAERAATFGNDEHDFPKTISYRLAADGNQLSAVLGGSKQISYGWKRGTRSPAPALEAADLAFAADTARRGVAGWVDAFDPKGGMMRRAGRVDHDGIAEAMQATLAAGRLDWAPIASGITGELGFTVGKAAFTGAKPDDAWRSTYATIWRHQPDGSWKVLFDTGRLIQEP
jgi:ketosteroid isomerase-like protein